MRQVIKLVVLVGLVLGITAIVIAVTAFWQEKLTIRQVLETIGFSRQDLTPIANKKQPIVSHLEDPFLAQMAVTIKSFDDKSVVLVFKDGGEILTYALNEEFVVIRVNNPEVKIKSYSVSILGEEDIGKDARLVPIYIRPKPELPEKKILGLYL